MNTFRRFGEAALLTTLVCVPLAYLLLLITGVPRTYPPLLPQQIIAGTVGGALLVTLGYALLIKLIPDFATRKRVLIGLAVVLCAASFYLPYRLTYTKSPRFAGATYAALIGQAGLHSLVVGLSVWVMLRKPQTATSSPSRSPVA